MQKNLRLEKTILINARVSDVWKALTDPFLIRQYRYVTEVKSDWKKDGDIVFAGEWNGVKYIDQGKIIDMIPEKLLHTAYTRDLSVNDATRRIHHDVKYEVQGHQQETQVIIIQDKISSQEELEWLDTHWTAILDSMKAVLEAKMPIAGTK